MYKSGYDQWIVTGIPKNGLPQYSPRAGGGDCDEEGDEGDEDGEELLRILTDFLFVGRERKWAAFQTPFTFETKTTRWLK